MTRELLNQLFQLHQMPTSDRDLDPKVITAYCEPWSLRAGETIDWFGSSLQATSGQLDLVKLNCGDPTRSGPGFSEEECEIVPSETIALNNQPVVPGSYAQAFVTTGQAESLLGVSLWFQPTLLKRDGVILSLESEGSSIEIYNIGTSLMGRFGDTEHSLRKTSLERRRWYFLTIDVSGKDGVATVSVSSPRSASPGRDLLQQGEEISALDIPDLTFQNPILRLAAGFRGERWDGRIAEPKLRVGSVVNEWQLETDMEKAVIPPTVGECELQLMQLPTRGVTGPHWTGEHQRWSDQPSEWNAIHFHHDDLYNAGWQPSHSVALPAELPSGIYCFRFQSQLGVDRVPFFVRPAADAQHSDVALLMPSATYMAYANHRMLIEGADFVGARTNLRPEHQYLVDHNNLGLSHYEKHPDGSGVMFSSRRRPVMQVRPGADGWNFTPDTDINAFLVHAQVDHDIVTDEDLHIDGYDALAPYRVIVTGSHPEYWSTAMLDALDEWQRSGGRLMYLGGNGFYWRVAFSDHWPGAIELRRAEDGVRNWQTGDGENYHAWGAEYGGLWRRNGRAPNQLVGIGFAAQGFEKATFYQMNSEAKASRAAWILEGVEEEEIGTSGLGGGAAGQEVDRYDQRLGSPGHAVILASATEFGADMLRTKEEFEGTVAFPNPDPLVRADMVFYETPEGGAVFSVGSISWFGALARNGYENDVARITSNVLERFLDPTPFPTPDEADT
ncbi:MAG: hypothetical protein CL414_00225 [Acidimicrobiaceae bacterium]|nr:hypothetical protein [Acidimicrobiaceae bacterium]